uniref:Major sperm protein n=1 Tax=Panagrolaimus superbus TaxID=310955 RepID=A0A914YWE4_9BILA
MLQLNIHHLMLKNFPEGEVKSSRSVKTARTQSDRTASAAASLIGINKNQSITPLITPPPTPAPPAATKKQDDSSRQTRQSLYLPAPGEKAPESPPPPRTPTASLYLPAPGEKTPPPNPMLNDSNYRLSSASNTSLASSAAADAAASISDSSVEGDKNPDDFITIPTKKLVFNSPFDYQALTYHVTVKNNSKKWIAYAIKSNAIPRVTAMPPSGILKPGDKQVIGITVQKFVYYDIDASKDRIAFDYLFCPAETKVFTHSLLQGTATRRRKNIKIEYNP